MWLDPSRSDFVVSGRRGWLEADFEDMSVKDIMIEVVFMLQESRASSKFELHHVLSSPKLEIGLLFDEVLGCDGLYSLVPATRVFVLLPLRFLAFCALPKDIKM